MRKTGNSLREASLIAIAGKQYAGKDVLTRLLLERLPDFTQVPIAKAIKLEFARQHDLTLDAIEQNKAHYRPDLIALGNWGRQQDPDYWLKAVLAEPGKKIISDMRLQREYDLLRAHDAFLIRLNADRGVRAQRGVLVSEDDPTENELDTVSHWDAILTNNTTLDDFIKQVDKLLFEAK